MSEEEIVELIAKALEVVVAVHADRGRHEINRTDLLAAIVQLRGIGLAAAKPDVRSLL